MILSFYVAIAGIAAWMAMAGAFSGIGTLSDYGFFFDRTWRVLHGYLPYRDFFCPTTPLSYYLHSVAWMVGGETASVSRIYLGVENAIFAAVSLTLLRLFNLPRWQLFFLSLVILAWSPFWQMHMPWYDADAQLFMLTGYGFLWAGVKKINPWLVGFSGACAGLAFLCKQNAGIAALAAMAPLPLLMLERPRWKSNLALLGTGFILVLGMALAIYLWFGSLHEIIEWLFKRPAEGKLRGATWGILASPLMTATRPGFGGLRLWLFVHAVFGFGLLFGYLRGRDYREPLALVWLSGATAWLLMLSKLGVNFWICMGAVFLIPLCAYRLTGRWAAHGGTLLCLLLAASGYRLHASNPALAVTPYALQASNIRGIHVDNVRGTAIDQMIKVIQEKMQPSETLWVYPDPTFIYRALNRPSPTSATMFIHGFEMRSSDQAKVIAELEQQRPMWAVLGMDGESIFNALKRFPELNRYIASTYRFDSSYGPYHLLKRSPSVIAIDRINKVESLIQRAISPN